MLQSEFEKLTGIKVSAEDYAAIETIYNESDLDKQTFCKEWLENDRDLMTKRMAEIIASLNERIFALHGDNEKQAKQIHALGMVLLNENERHPSDTLRESAIQALGFKEYINIKLKDGYSICQDDRDELIELINK
jgi:hypothetical protein